MSDVVVTNNPEAHRYEASLDGVPAGFAEYVVTRDVITFVHTEVGDAFEGEGIGSALAQGAIDDVRAVGTRKVRATCPFIAVWLRRHPENNDLLADPTA